MRVVSLSSDGKPWLKDVIQIGIFLHFKGGNDEFQETDPIGNKRPVRITSSTEMDYLEDTQLVFLARVKLSPSPWARSLRKEASLPEQRNNVEEATN